MIGSLTCLICLMGSMFFFAKSWRMGLELLMELPEYRLLGDCFARALLVSKEACEERSKDPMLFF